MKKIFAEVKNLMKVYLRYRFIITEDKIELKITPKSNQEDEINWIVDNDKDGKIQLFLSLQNLSSKNGI